MGMLSALQKCGAHPLAHGGDQEEGRQQQTAAGEPSELKQMKPLLPRLSTWHKLCSLILRFFSSLSISSSPHLPLQAKLALLPEWPAFVSPGGPLDVLLQVQAGELCGPKPVAASSATAGSLLGGLTGNGLAARGGPGDRGSGGSSFLFGESDLPPAMLEKLREMYLK